jgi:K+-sensing histidine kinase KdpD
MVCVTRQKTCARLIELGARLAFKHRAQLLVVHALRNGECVMGDRNESEAMELLFTQTNESGGELLIVRADDVAGTLVQTAKEQGAKIIVLGATPVSEPVSFAARLKTMLPDREIICVEGEISEGDIHISMNA